MPYFGNSILKNYVILLLDDPKLLLFVYLSYILCFNDIELALLVGHSKSKVCPFISHLVLDRLLLTV